ncbi:SlyX family protein [Stutzerimonas stutzeri]|uniref:SlyX family protein n=1 Tax=Stutzerimonas sp. S1 TaxID=3030652 RepID=UPI002224073A|nr:SlyX family protein [Stutzerimonas sp. S1]MCW3148365.1 SlyX family protein [Stutzerimonas sp. S1]
MDADSRIAELEARLAFQDDTIQTLNDVLIEQRRLVDRLQLQLEVLARRQEEMQSRMSDEEDDAPPHY